ncbi:BRO family protein [Nocardioides sp. ChNu-99]|uniref:BRO family protein n=1 Tax=Nocardioides sp. ChNu-99 TaxID=2839897 RepID=UPI0024073549|nr:BRO family protein [Nocardioides sp. ChNu-99]MDF9717384.1 phage antirepressor KilAC domain-containing protein [Nocardioides sp. ChNu-99]
MGILTAYSYAQHEVRTISVDGEPWFVAADVCAVLEHSNPSMAVAGLDDDERGLRSVETPGGAQQLVCVSEAGLYSLIMRSRKPEAKAFKRWVTHDVLPAIRRTGRYGSDVEMLAALPSSKLLALAAQAAERAEAAEERARELEAPAGAWKDLSAAEGDFTVSDAAKLLRRAGIVTGPRRLYSWLADNGWAFRRGGRWQAMQTAVNAGWLVERVTSGYFDEKTGERHQGDPQIRVTPKGLERLRAVMGERALAVVPS